MTDAPTEAEIAAEAPAQKARRRLGVIAWITLGLASVVVILLLAVTATRYGVLLPQARLLIEARTDGLKLGRIGKLKLTGISGDVFRDFGVKRLTISDDKGVWLEGRDLHVRWTYWTLLRRRLTIDDVQAAQIRLIRRPELGPKGVDRGLPLSFDIDHLKARIDLEPAFAQRSGSYLLEGGFDIERAGGKSGKIAASSLTHLGDRLDLAFDFGKAGKLMLDAKAMEAQGGALAGALGLAADQPFKLDAKATGDTSNGRFTVASLSGNRTPIEGSGAWNPDGGQATGRIDLESSRLLRVLARMAGPTAAFDVRGVRRDAQYHTIDARLTADNVTLVAGGPANLGKRAIAPEGLRLDLAVKDMTRITHYPAMRAGRLNGVLTRAGTDWRLAGNASVERPELLGYRLATASGPFTLKLGGGVLDIDAKADGQGGGGSGVLAAALGGRPHLEANVVRLKDGAFLFKALQVKAPGIDVTGEGGRTILGGLTFKGQADFTNMAGVRPGAKGAVSAKWSATQSSGERPWTITLDGRGERFATGMDQLDRLLGAAPTLKAQANFRNGVFSIADANLKGTAGDLHAAGLFGPDAALKLKLDWRAQGPFRAGPVEVSGKVSGTGALTGSIAAPKADLIADVDQIDVPRLPLEKVHLTLSFRKGANGSDGAFAATGTSAYGPARGRADFRFAKGGVDLSGIDVDAGGLAADGSFALRSGAPSVADLTLAVGPGAFLERGKVVGAVKIVDAGGGPQVVLNLQALGASPGGELVIRSGRLAANGPLARLPYTVAADGSRGGDPWRINGTGALIQQKPGYQLAFDGEGRVRGADFKTLQTADIRFGGPVESAALRLAVGGGEAVIDARREAGRIAANARLQGVGLRLLSEDLAGQMDATLSMQGAGDDLNGLLDAKLTGAGARGDRSTPRIDAVVKARIGDQIVIDAQATNSQGLRADVNLNLPAETSAAPFRIAIANKRPMSGRFSADGELKPLWDLVLGGDRSLSGHLKADGTIGGSLGDPSIRGSAVLAQGRFDDGATGLQLRDVNLSAAFDGEHVEVAQATAADGHGGSLNGQGTISLRRAGVSTFRMTLKDFQLIANDLATAVASGDATINRGADGQVKVAGALTIDRAEISAAEPLSPSGVTPMDVIEVNKPDTPQTIGLEAKAGARKGLAVGLDVTLRAPRRVFVRGRGLDVELSVDAQVRGTTDKPDLTGTARVVRGDYNFADKRFEFDDHGVIYLAASPAQIRLDLSATREDPSLTAVVKIAGTAAKPEITLTSNPVLPNDEVLSQVLFGRSASQLSPLEAAQLASSLSALAGGGGFDVIGNLRNLAGLDRLAFAGGGDGSGFSVAGGKYLTDDVYLEIAGGGREGPSAQVEWRVRRNLSILSRFASSGDGRLAVRWRKDY